jgi:hypothetical protein
MNSHGPRAPLPPRSSPPPIVWSMQAEGSASEGVQMLQLPPAPRTSRGATAVSREANSSRVVGATSVSARGRFVSRDERAQNRVHPSREAPPQDPPPLVLQAPRAPPPQEMEPQVPPNWYMRHRRKPGATLNGRRQPTTATATPSAAMPAPRAWELGRKPYPGRSYVAAAAVAPAPSSVRVPPVSKPSRREALRPDSPDNLLGLGGADRSTPWLEPMGGPPRTAFRVPLPPSGRAGAPAGAAQAEYVEVAGAAPNSAASAGYLLGVRSTLLDSRVGTPRALPELPEHLAHEAMARGASLSVASAAENFEAGHADLRQGARRQLATLSMRPQSVRTGTLYAAQMGEMWFHRLVVPDAAPEQTLAFESRPPPRRRRPKRPLWRLDLSCWNIRRDFFEEDWMLSSLLDADWLVACGSHGLGWYITKCHHDPAEWQLLDRSVAHAGVGHAHEVLRARAHLVYGAFDYYAALHSEVQTVAGEPNIYSLTFNAFMAFVTRCGMVSRRCPHGDFEAIFAVVDAYDTSQVRSSSRRRRKRERKRNQKEAPPPLTLPCPHLLLPCSC